MKERPMSDKELRLREVEALESLAADTKRLVKLKENKQDRKDRKTFDGGMGMSHSALFRR